MKKGDRVRVKSLSDFDSHYYSIGDILTIEGIAEGMRDDIAYFVESSQGLFLKDIELIQEDKMKVGDKVEVIDWGWGCGQASIGKRGVIVRISDFKYIFKTDDGLELSSRKEGLKLIQEDKMKDTITLRELIEQGACKEGVLWFIDKMPARNFTFAQPESQDVDGYPCHPGNYFTVKSVTKQLKEDNHPEYITWLKDHGYAVDDKQDKINELEKKMADLQAELEELKK
jgi:hypothetical protein